MATETRYFSDGLRAEPDYLANEQTLPDTTSADGNRGPGNIGRVQGALEVVAKAYEDISLTGDLTIALEASETEGGTYAAVPGATFTDTNPSYSGGDEIVRFALESGVGPWVKVVLTSSATPTGSVNVYPAHAAR